MWLVLYLAVCTVTIGWIGWHERRPPVVSDPDITQRLSLDEARFYVHCAHGRGEPVGQPWWAEFSEN